ncbi:MAG: RNA polymerase sigma factor [Acidimicrobiia bacterium]
MTLDEVVRIEGGRVLATLIRLCGDFDLAEEALQDAVVVALERWPQTGLPDNPGAWLTTAARNKALDRLRREAHRSEKETEAFRMLAEPPAPPHSDDRLRLIFTCCHPALSPAARVALTLRTIGGLTTTEIARTFLVPEPTMGQRISRAKRKIAVARIPYRVPEPHELVDRIPAVLAVLYLIFTTGHHAPGGRLDSRVDLAEEAIRLGRILVELMLDEAECQGLLSLMLATHARRDSRLDTNGNLVLLPDQDRSRWDHVAIAEAADTVDKVLRRGAIGPYQVQAAIACLHGLAGSDATTDWKQIVDLYRRLEQITPSPVVTVNRAVAEAKVFGPEVGLALLEQTAGVEQWHRYWSTMAAFLRQADRIDEADRAYRSALECEMNESDRRFLEGQLRSLV